MTVHLVGAGPGDPDLLTMRAVSLLTQADVIVHDRLVDTRVLAFAAPWAEIVDVGKTPGSCANRQSDINALLVERGLRFDTVVRLKGGDPFVFGRGGEEAEALRAAGVEVAVVPGVSSAIAAPAAAGIPVTMRGVSSGVTIVTAHQDPDAAAADGEPVINWTALAQAGTTLVVLMGAARARRIAERLIGGGLAATTPVAVITSATNADQEVVRLTLAELGLTPVRNPATIVVGAVAARDVISDGELAALAEVTP